MKILITGGSSGIGHSIAEYLAQRCEVTVLDQQAIHSEKIKFYYADLQLTSDIDRFFVKSDQYYDVLINAAGVREIIPPHELDIDEWERVQKINVTAPFLLSKYLIRQALANNKKLSIINIASISGVFAEPDRAAYVTSKHAIIGLTKQLAFQYGKYNIRVNAIAPGIIETPLTKAYFANTDMVNHIKKHTPVGYWGNPQHLHSLVDVCLTNDYMTGSVLVCDGGWSCGKTL